MLFTEELPDDNIGRLDKDVKRDQERIQGRDTTMNRYLFLDIDGVLNSDKTTFAYQKIVHSNLVKHRMENNEPLNSMFDPISVLLLLQLQKALGFKIVISSTWRKHLSVQQFHRLFNDYNWDTSEIIIGITPELGNPRGKEIQSWLDSHAKYPYQYCILDDSEDMLESQMPFFVRTTLEHGLDAPSYHKIFRVFAENSDQGILLP